LKSFYILSTTDAVSLGLHTGSRSEIRDKELLLDVNRIFGKQEEKRTKNLKAKLSEYSQDNLEKVYLEIRKLVRLDQVTACRAEDVVQWGPLIDDPEEEDGILLGEIKQDAKFSYNDEDDEQRD